MGRRVPRRLSEGTARGSVARDPLGAAPARGPGPDPGRAVRNRRDGRAVRRRGGRALAAPPPRQLSLGGDKAVAFGPARVTAPEGARRAHERDYSPQRMAVT